MTSDEQTLPSVTEEEERQRAAFRAAYARNPDKLIACPACDTLHAVGPVAPGEVARCRRCHFTLIAPKKDTLNRTIALSVASAVLMVTMLCFPFLTMSRQGLTHEVSVLGIVLSLSSGWYLLLAVAVALFVIALPMMRAAALVYVMLALKQGRVAPGSRSVFRFAERIMPWTMTEIFIIGTGVSLVKIAGLAKISFDAAFWLFLVLVLVLGLKNAAVCRWSVWALIRERET